MGKPKGAKTPLISIIVPVYNVEKYVARCVDSILAQTYAEIEILLVDDGSTDRSGEICDSYAGRDLRVKVIHKENGGLSDARNAGMQEACGEYFSFVDSDDYIAADYIEYLYGILSENGAQVSICGYRKVHGNDTNAIWGKNDGDMVRIYDSWNGLRALLYQRGITTSAWGRLFKRELFRGVRFPKGRQHEDMAVMYRLFEAAAAIAAGNGEKYFYFQRDGSIVNSGFDARRMDYVYLTQECIDYMAVHRPDLEKAAVSRHFSACYDLLDCIGDDRESHIDEYRQLVGEIKKHRRTVLLDSQARLRNRLAAAGSFISVDLVRRLCRLARRQ